MPNDEKTFMVENARILFRNFRGEAGRYNKEGERSFSVVIDDPQTAKALAKDGWNVKTLKPREDEEEEEGTPYIPVKVNYAFKPPRVWLITSSGRTPLSQEMISILDWANIENVDLICRAYDWHVNDKQGIAAYLKTMFVTIEEDELEKKYAVIPQEA